MKNTLKIYKPSLEWYVYRMDYTTKKIVVFNIFEHSKFEEEVKQLINIPSIDKEQFTEKLKSILFYYYASRCEYEIGITSWRLALLIKKQMSQRFMRRLIFTSKLN